MAERTMPTLEERLRSFRYHQVNQNTAEKMTRLREQYYRLAEVLMVTLPDNRSRSLALTALEESAMRAIQCYALSEGIPIPIPEAFPEPGKA